MAFLAFVFILLPGSFLLAVAAGRAWSGAPPAKSGGWLRANRKAFTALAYSLVPLGLAAWIAFSLSFVLANLSYLWPSISDPLGWGWDLFHTASLAWTPYLTGWRPALQVMVLLIGLGWAARTAVRIADQTLSADRPTARGKALRLALPVVAFCLAVTAGFLALLVA
jgi:hypothetical protein